MNQEFATRATIIGEDQRDQEAKLNALAEMTDDETVLLLMDAAIRHSANLAAELERIARIARALSDDGSNLVRQLEASIEMRQCAQVGRRR